MSSFLCSIHGAQCTNGPSCNVGMRVNHVTVLQGAVVPIWGTLEQLLDKYAMQLSKGEAVSHCIRHQERSSLQYECNSRGDLRGMVW